MNRLGTSTSNNYIQERVCLKRQSIPLGDKLQKALQEFSELVKENQDVERWKLLEKVVIKFDLSPKECDFLERHFKEE